MIQFALSGPVFGFAAVSLFSLVFVGSRFYQNPFSDSNGISENGANSETFFLVINAESAVDYESPIQGSLERIKEGESIIQFDSIVHCTATRTAVAEAAEKQKCFLQMAVYRGMANSLQFGPNSSRENVQFDGNMIWNSSSSQFTESGLEKVWEDYIQSEYPMDAVDKEWSAVMKKLSAVEFKGSSEPRTGCRLCASTGKRKCWRCGGQGSTESPCSLCADTGSVDCEWCK
eukprot:CAMPEP_0182446622 /NCGR_PEP_ID=MMETSP1172-20130603/4314_1 /TAXON_ID=708627 /ORGANISM="Timspurckia oligopyrenoides, Strain CCMP3278" /LENGTH=230 /DNA_ID=CAMNT_0024642575 /DNA_START=141 /DNA_END=833 /DNA_ORIENTATION=+